MFLFLLPGLPSQGTTWRMDSKFMLTIIQTHGIGIFTQKRYVMNQVHHNNQRNFRLGKKILRFLDLLKIPTKDGYTCFLGALKLRLNGSWWITRAPLLGDWNSGRNFDAGTFKMKWFEWSPWSFTKFQFQKMFLPLMVVYFSIWWIWWVPRIRKKSPNKNKSKNYMGMVINPIVGF